MAMGTLEIKLCVQTYRLFYVSKTEEVLWRRFSKEELESGAAKLKKVNDMRKKWIDTKM
jgi:paired amphipathic helix protein Sin3a